MSVYFAKIEQNTHYFGVFMLILCVFGAIFALFAPFKTNASIGVPLGDVTFRGTYFHHRYFLCNNYAHKFQKCAQYHYSHLL